MQIVTRDELWKYYVGHQNDFVEKYDGLYIVLVDNEVKGSFKDATEAYQFAVDKFEPDTFLLQLVGPGEENYSATYYSRVIF